MAIRSRIRLLFACRRGATAIEYGLIAALIGIAIVGSLRALGGGTGGMWTNLSTTLANV